MLTDVPVDSLVHAFGYVGCHRTLVALELVHPVVRWAAADDGSWEPLCQREFDADTYARAQHDMDFGHGWCGWKTLYGVRHQGHVMRKVVGFIKACAVGAQGGGWGQEGASMLGGLVSLDLSNTCLGAEGTRRLCRALEGNRVLEKLDVSGQLMRDSVRGLVDVMVTMPRLRCVDLSGNKLGAGNADSVRRLLEECRLRRLDVAQNYLGAAGAQQVALGIRAPAAPAAGTLHGAAERLYLNLDRNDVGDGGVGAVLERAGHLRALSLRDNGITKQGLAAVVRFLEGAPAHFESVDVSNEGTSERGWNHTKRKVCDALEQACVRGPGAGRRPRVVYTECARKEGCSCM